MARLPGTRLRFALIGLIITTATTIQAAGTCYYPNGVEADDSPCDPSADTSACCGGSQGTACLDNGLCRSGDGGTIRGSCTDQDWNNCPNNYCLSADTGGTDLISCSNVTKSNADYCCDHTNGCCDSGVGRFQVLPSNPVTLATWGGSGFVVIETSTSTPTPTTSTSTSSTSSSSTTSTADTTPTGTETAGGVNDAQPTDSNSDSGLSSGAKIGIGVGISMGTLLMIGMAYIIWRLRRTDRLLKQSSEGAAAATGGGGGGGGGAVAGEGLGMAASTTPNSWGAPTAVSHEIDSNPAMSELDNKGYYAPPVPPAELASHNHPASELDGRLIQGGEHQQQQQQYYHQ